jgi:cholesterol 7-dehydrogenase
MISFESFIYENVWIERDNITMM